MVVWTCPNLPECFVFVNDQSPVKLSKWKWVSLQENLEAGQMAESSVDKLRS